jgi:hypothetical protein
LWIEALFWGLTGMVEKKPRRPHGFPFRERERPRMLCWIRYIIMNGKAFRMAIISVAVPLSCLAAGPVGAGPVSSVDTVVQGRPAAAAAGELIDTFFTEPEEEDLDEFLPESGQSKSDLRTIPPLPDSALVPSGGDSVSIIAGDSSSCTLSDSLAQIPALPVRPAWLYAGLSLEQDSLARQLLRAFMEYDWNGVEKAGKKMQRLEKKHHLPPLSWLLLVGTNVMRIQNGEYERGHDARTILKDIAKYSAKGIDLALPEAAPDSIRATMLFITGGIKGFIATLDIDRNPVNAALFGFAAHNLLAEAVTLDTALHDAYLGLGLFNCALAKAPLIVRGALAIIGKGVSLARGLDYLRRSASGGCYTNDIARLYLVQFLSPYLGHEAGEKRNIFGMLQRAYPRNPYYLFIEIEEYLCFDPGAFYSFSFKTRVARRMKRLKTDDYSARRYAQLVKWQYLLMDPFPSRGLMPDTTFNLRGFSYYPEFLRALRERVRFEPGIKESRSDRIRRIRYFRMLGLKAMKTLEASPAMPAGRKSYYLWHIRDALDLERQDQL